ncbi:hypothetical protein [Polyangium jinanense]|uniref:Lipoprotein n=1 Tax=Polyangium jinanense TaxID=2829994 RepID=A0A9X3XE23_9BACT|nr:hypothetical protein [Polyangium jinanense]MDC3958499.1 hypothetical protein [Polyangium jinanense]MDC3987328.1 hypothetical protein [Polyangium jinanense]
MIRPSLRSRPAFAALALLATSLVACSNTQVTSTVTGEPVCADFTLGGANNKMRGGLRQPVRVTVLDDDDQIARVMILGKRAEGDPGARLVLPDANAEYKVEWAQCGNERASVPLRAGKTPERDLTTYECGEAKVYKTDPLVTKKGDRASHAFTFQPPPNAACWTDERPTEEPPKPAPEAAPPAEPADAGAEDAATDAATDAAPADAGTDAGKPTGATEKPADGTKDKPAEAPKTEAPKPAPAAPKPPEGPKPATTR